MKSFQGNDIHEFGGGPFNASYEQSNRDMCTIAATTLRSLWFSMGSAQKMLLWPKILGAVLEVSLYEDESLREITIPIFYDMLETEHFYMTTGNESKSGVYTNSQNMTPSSLAQNLLSTEYHSIDGLSDGSKLLSNVISDTHFNLRCNDFRNSSSNSSTELTNLLITTQRFTDEFIMQLDPLIDSNRGSEEFRIKFREMFLERCVSSSTMHNSFDLGVNFGVKFVEKVDKLLELLLNYRQVRLNSDCIENGMFCTVQLIDFYQKIGENALYINYLYKLYNLHVMSGNCVEAALTLKKHANLLKWSDEKLESYMIVKLAHKRCETHVKLKEKIYIEVNFLGDFYLLN